MLNSLFGAVSLVAALLAVLTARPAYAFVSVDGDRFVDSEGCQIIFHGAAVIEKSKSRHYLGSENADDFALMQASGFNCTAYGKNI